MGKWASVSPPPPPQSKFLPAQCCCCRRCSVHQRTRDKGRAPQPPQGRFLGPLGPRGVRHPCGPHVCLRCGGGRGWGWEGVRARSCGPAPPPARPIESPFVGPPAPLVSVGAPPPPPPPRAVMVRDGSHLCVGRCGPGAGRGGRCIVTRHNVYKGPAWETRISEDIVTPERLHGTSCNPPPPPPPRVGEIRRSCQKPKTFFGGAALIEECHAEWNDNHTATTA